MKKKKEMSVDTLKNTQKKGLVLNGGGVLGVAHVGALKRLNELGKFEYEYYAGSSVGAIIATGMALDASYEFIERLVARVDFNVLLDDTPYDANVLDILRLLRKYGWYKGEALKELYRSFIHDLTGNGDITMLEAFNLTGKFLLLTAFRTNDSTTVEITKDTYPHVPVKDALYWSSSYPFLFATEPVRAVDIKHYTSVDPGCDVVFIDGGTLNNYPFDLLAQYTPIETILGLHLSNDKEELLYNNSQRCAVTKLPPPPTNILAHTLVCAEAIRMQAMSSHVSAPIWANTISINVGSLSSTDFNITQETKSRLFQIGYDSVLGPKAPKLF